MPFPAMMLTRKPVEELRWPMVSRVRPKVHNRAIITVMPMAATVRIRMKNSNTAPNTPARPQPPTCMRSPMIASYSSALVMKLPV
ncbi:MAG: hypothetical protein BWY17_05122 [Deltaproteobacteria bacterium ADurb.Bin207]|nr:MAG: hypothetical protein BWY17_05122 [Deltaproteobacteria bacterium ADurb.Bin207]